MKRYLSCLPLVVLGVVLLQVPSPIEACAPAPPRNQPVEIADESAIIVWDEANKTQHFIRRASFKTEAQDFGFLVPTPTQPTLAEAEDAAFDTLAKLTEPEIVKQPRPSSPGCGIGCSAAAPMAGAPKSEPPVRVLDEQRVGGYDAVVLEADDALALSSWLKERNYDFSPVLTEWADHYIKAKWKITAFKIAKPKEGEKVVGTSAVRMTFKTERPFFPYREPKSASAGPQPQRLLRVFFISNGKTKGTLDDKDVKWPGRIVWSNKIEDVNREQVLKQLKLPNGAGPASWWLTEFEDHASPRPGTADVYFSAADDQTPVKRPPHIQYVSSAVPNCLMCCALAAYLMIAPFVRGPWRRLMKRFNPNLL